jgi:DNA-binding XRE family transcriptional regulator
MRQETGMKTLRQHIAEIDRDEPGFAKRIEEKVEQLKISEALKAARKSAGMTQGEVAERMHVNRAYISQLEGRPQNITVATLIKYTGAIGGDLSFKIKPPVKVRVTKSLAVHA